MVKYFSLFSGIGGFELGIQYAHDSRNNQKQKSDQEGISTNGNSAMSQYGTRWSANPECVGYSEIDKYAIQIYQKHFPTHKNYGDITKIDWSTVPDFDLLTGGSPCQDLSIAGKRAGLGGERSGLFYEYVRCIEEKKPSYFIWENVKGALSSNKGWDFAGVLNAFSEAGYDIQWQVLNSKDFGVPQNRERIFVVGSRGTPRPKVFPIISDGRATDGIQRYVSNTLTARYEGAQATGTYIGEGKLNAQEIAIPVLTPDRLKKRQNGRRFKENGEPSFTLTSQDKHGIYDGATIRRLTPTECERLQGFPDGWTEGVSDTRRYQTLGNAVTVNVVREVMKRIL